MTAPDTDPCDDVPAASPAPQAMDELLPAYLRHRDVPCPNCSYNLRDLTGTSCPECGQRLELVVDLGSPLLSLYRHLRRTRLRLDAWPVWLSALPLFLAALAPLAVWLLAQLPDRLREYRDPVAGCLTVLMTGIAATMLVIWWRRMGDMLQMPIESQVFFVAASWIIGILILWIYSLPALI